MIKKRILFVSGVYVYEQDYEHTIRVTGVGVPSSRLKRLFVCYR